MQTEEASRLISHVLSGALRIAYRLQSCFTVLASGCWPDRSRSILPPSLQFCQGAGGETIGMEITACIIALTEKKSFLIRQSRGILVSGHPLRTKCSLAVYLNFQCNIRIRLISLGGPKHLRFKIV